MNSSSMIKPTPDEADQQLNAVTPSADSSAGVVNPQAALSSFQQLLAEYKRAGYEWASYWHQATTRQ